MKRQLEFCGLMNLTVKSSALPFLVLLCALNCVAQEHFEVTRFIGYTHRSVFGPASVDDLVRGFPRVEFEVTRDLPATWISAKIRITVDGSITSKKGTYPVQHINETVLPILDVNTRSFTTPLPEGFRNSEITHISIVMVEGTMLLPSKSVLAKARVVTLNSSPRATYEDDYVSLEFSFSPHSQSISISGRNKSSEKVGFLGDWKAIIATELEGLPTPPASHPLHYGQSPPPGQGNTFWVEPEAPLVMTMDMTDWGPCRSQTDARVEVEQDLVCKTAAPVFSKYARLLDEAYLVVRVLLPVQLQSQVRDYVFTFVVTTDTKTPKKKNPDAVVVKV